MGARMAKYKKKIYEKKKKIRRQKIKKNEKSEKSFALKSSVVEGVSFD